MLTRPNAIRNFSIAIFPILLGLFALVYLRDSVRYISLLREDALVEWLTFACLFGSGLLALEIFVHFLQREQRIEWFYLAFGLFCILFALEEISWGQRIIGIQSPDFFLGRSDQQEVNVHNVLQQQFDFKTKDLAALVLSAYGLVLPLLNLISFVKRLIKRFRVVVPPLFLMVGFLLGTLLMGDEPTGWEEEIGEFFFGLSFLLFMWYELVVHSPDNRIRPIRVPTWLTGTKSATVDTFTVMLLTLLGAVVRLWQLGESSYSLVEAANLFGAGTLFDGGMAQLREVGTVAAIAWLLPLQWWSGLVGDGELATRLLPVSLGIVCILLVWFLLKSIVPNNYLLRTTSTVLVALSPSLVYYSQDLASTSLLVTMTVLSLCAAVWLAAKPRVWRTALFVAANWLLIALNPYATIVLLAEVVFLMVHGRNGAHPAGAERTKLVAAVVVSTAPLLVWMLVPVQQWSPVVLVDTDAVSGFGIAWRRFANAWRAVFGQFELQQLKLASHAYLYTPLVLLGIWTLVRGDKSASASPPLKRAFAWLLTVASVTPILLGVFIRPPLVEAAMPLTIPLLLILASYGIQYLWQHVRLVGLAGVLLLLIVSLVGLRDIYAGLPKGEYAQMAQRVGQLASPDDALLLLNAQQYPLTALYMDASGTAYALPELDLDSQWRETPITIVPEEVDGRIQQHLQDHATLWLLLNGEDVVDRGDFVRKYMVATSHFVSCDDWLDVEACGFISPHYWRPDLQEPVQFLYGDELALEAVSIGTSSFIEDSAPILLSTLDWRAEKQPTVDYTVSLRLVNDIGEVVAQRDEMPIGTLLPPTTWAQGDRKPGYMALQLPPEIPAGAYTVQLQVYDPATVTPIVGIDQDGVSTDTPRTLASVTIAADEITITPIP